MKSIKKERDSNIELYRVLGIFLVVMIHLLNKTSAIYMLEKETAIYYITWILMAICKMGNNMLILISGYYWHKTKFSIDKVLQLCITVLFYSVGLAVIAKWVLGIPLVSEWKDIFHPVINNEYWFMKVYIGLYCTTPFLKIFIESLSKENFRYLAGMLFIMFSFIPTVFGKDSWMNDGGAYGIVWFVVLYLFGAYINKYKETNVKWSRVFICIGGILVPPVCRFIIDYLYSHAIDVKIKEVDLKLEIIGNPNSIFILCASVALFYIFMNVKIHGVRIKKIINKLGQGCLGVYLIHNNRNIAKWLWEKLEINYWLVEENNLLVIFIIGMVVFIVCNLIELVRLKLFEIMHINQIIMKIVFYLKKYFLRWFKEVN